MEEYGIGKDLEIYRRKPPKNSLGRGDSIFAFPDDYVCVDIETTGLNPKRNDIIEICIYRIRGRQLFDKFVTFVRPPTPIPRFITKMTGITDEMVSDAPPISKIISDVREFIGSDLILGHNIPFDIGFINRALHRNGLPLIYNDIIDTVRISRKLKPKPHKLESLAEYFGVISPMHRAEADVQTTIGCFEKMREIWLQECESREESDQ